MIQYTECELHVIHVSPMTERLLKQGLRQVISSPSRVARYAAIVLAVAFCGLPLAAQSGPVWLPHVPFVETTPELSRAMLTLAGTGPSDVVYDLGCGDGRIVIQAARDFGARGVGIDIDPQRIAEANSNARAAGVAGKVRFVLGDLLYADIHDATVVAMFLLPTVNAHLRPKLFRDLRPGTRIVTHHFDIGDWQPQKRLTVGNAPVYLWTIPETTRVTGRVLLEDESPPPIPATIAKICGTRNSFEGFTDAIGNFTLALARGKDQDAAQAHDGSGCHLSAELPGYRSAEAPLQATAGTLVLKRVSRARGLLVSVGARQAPVEAQVAYEKGRAALARGEREVAHSAFTQATRMYPAYAAAWFELGSLAEAAARMDESSAYFGKAIALEPDYLSPYLGMIQVEMHADRWDAISEWAAKVIALDPESFPDAHLYHAIGKLTRKDFAAAERSARTAMQLDTAHQFPRAEYVLGLALAAQGDLDGARQHLEHYIAADPKAPDLVQIRQRLKLLEDARMPAPAAVH